MSYIGQQLPADVFSGFTTDTFAGDGSATTFTLSKAPFSEDGLIVVINNVIQKPTTNFTVSGTTLTIVGTAVASGDVIYAMHTSGAVPITLASKVDVNGLSDGVILDADADTTISADTDDQIDFKIGGVDETTMSSSGIVINEGSNDRDFRIESNGKANMFFVDGGNDRIGINTAGNANHMVNIEDVTGNGGGTLGLSCPTSGTSDNCGRLHFGNATDPVVAAIFGIADGANDAGALTFRTEATGAALEERMRIDSSGNVMVAVTTANAEGGVTIDADGGLNGTSQIRFNRANTTETSFPLSFMDNSGSVGFVSYTNSATTFSTSSDYRLKENVVTDWDATTRLKELKPSRFNFKVNADTTVDGFLAHEVSDIVPEAITGDKDATETKEKVVINSNGHVIAEGIEEANWTAGKVADEDGNIKYPSDSTWEASKVVPVYQAIDQSKLVPLLVKTVQELEARIKTLEDA